MSVISTITDIQNDTAYQKSKEYFQGVSDSSKESGNDRNVGGVMGKNDFLLLLSAQLRYQDPLNPQNDSDFASQLAQFSSLEQMQNMNTSLNNMSNYQSYNLVGKFVLAEAMVDGVYSQVPGVVDSIFVSKGVTYAQIGEFVVPVSSITEIFDTNNILTSEMFMQTSNHLIGRTIIAEVNGKEIEGVVTRILVDKGALLAQVDDGTDEPKFVSVNSIVDIRETGTERYSPKPETPPDALFFKPCPETDGFVEYAEDDWDTPIGRWDWDAEQWEWLYTSFLEEEVA